MRRRLAIASGSLIILLASLWIGAHWLVAPFTPAIGWERTWSELRYGQVERLVWRMQEWRLTPQGKVQLVIGCSVIGLGAFVAGIGFHAVRRPGGSIMVRG